MSANIKFLSDFIFLNFQRTHDRIDIYRFPNKKGYFLRFQIIMFETLKQMKSDKNRYLLTLFVLIWFTIQKRRGKIQIGEIHVHQGLSKVFVFYTYSNHPVVRFWVKYQKLSKVEIIQIPFTYILGKINKNYDRK